MRKILVIEEFYYEFFKIFIIFRFVRKFLIPEEMRFILQLKAKWSFIKLIFLHYGSRSL
jgi:hypothetical protein